MIRRYLRRLLDTPSTETVEEQGRELETIREEVLGTQEEQKNDIKELKDRLDTLESWKDAKSREISSNSRATEHILDALSHTIEELEKENEALHSPNIEQRIEKIEQRLQKIEKSSTPGKTGVEASGRASGRPSKRSDDEDGRRPDIAERADGAKRGKELWEKTTPAQRNILKVLYDTGYPMSYREIAEEVGRSVSTVKNHINNLKAAGFEFKEDSAYNNTKKYLIDDRLQAFLTLRLNE